MDTNYIASEAYIAEYKQTRREARKNLSYAISFCNSNGLKVALIDGKYKLEIRKADGTKIGVVQAWPSNNGNYYGYRYNCLYHWADRASFSKFEDAVEAVTRTAFWESRHNR